MSGLDVITLNINNARSYKQLLTIIIFDYMVKFKQEMSTIHIP